MQPANDKCQSQIALNSALVTGATGFIGRHLVARLRSLGVSVTTVSGSDGFDLLRDKLPLKGIDRVFHLAAKTGVVDAWDNPVDFFSINALGTMQILEQCRSSGVSVTNLSPYIYGQPKQLPIPENAPVNADNPYAFTKYVGEQICSFYARYYAVNCVTLRLFNVYGPGQQKKFLVPFIMAQVLDPDCLTIEVKDLAPQRDYIYVDDVIDAILASTQAPAGSIFNIGSGAANSVEEVIKTALDAVGLSKPYRAFGERRRNELDCVIVDTTALRSQINWVPRFTLKDGLAALASEMQRLSGSCNEKN